MVIANTASAIWRRVLPDLGPLNPEIAQFVLDLHFPKADLVRINQLSAKAREGSLSPEESAELDEYIHVGDVLALWQSKARIALKNLPPPK